MIPKFYCINLKESKERKSRMITRFEYHKLNYAFIEAVNRNEEMITSLLSGYHDITFKSRSECACMQSHLKAIKTFIESSEDEYAVICEDDILFHNNFTERFKFHFDNLPDNSNILMLGYFIEKWIGFSWSGKDLGIQNLCSIVPEHTWGAFCYLISRNYAKQVLEMYVGKRWVQMRHRGFLTSEMITRFSFGFLCYPILVIEEAIDSTIRGKEELKFHEAIFGVWRYENFSASEKEHISPLKNWIQA